jgi:chaperone modulatory protein CbpM
MSDRFTEDEAIAAVPRLTRTRLSAFVEAEVVIPSRGEEGLVFRHIDIARLELMCELCEEFDLDAEALALVGVLIDQLHAARRDLRALAEALADEPPEIHARLGAALRRMHERSG